MAHHRAEKILRIAGHIKPYLRGLPPEEQGAILAELLSIWLAGHPPEVREAILAVHLEKMRELIQHNEPPYAPWRKAKH